MKIFLTDFCGHAFPMKLSRELASRGHEVCHVFFADNTSTPKGQWRMAGDPDTLTIEGLHIKRKFSKHSLLTRRQADLEYGEVTAARMNQFRPDVVISSNMPLDAQKILLEATHRIHSKFVFWIQDVYSIAVRFVLEKKLKALAWAGAAYFERLEKKLLRQSDAIICIAPGFAELLTGWGLPASKMSTISNWAPMNEVLPTGKNNAWAREHGVADKFCFMYSGTLGMKHRPELLFELAKHLARRKDARLVVIAGGAGADWLASKANELDSEVLQLLPFQPYERISEVMGSANVLITLLDSNAGAFAVPSKTLSYLCAGRPQIIAAPAVNEAAQVVKQANAGLVVSPDEPQQLIDAAESMLSNPALCAEYGRNAREYAERTFDIKTIANRFMAVFEGSAAASPERDVARLVGS